jgi:nucleotide-binding universal stress UspA family protein
MFEIRRIIAASDFSDCARRAVAHARKIARHFDATLTVLHVNASPPFEPVERALEEHVAVEGEDRRKLQRVVLIGPPATTILSAARVLDADLIVMGTRGHSRVKHLVLGSVAEEVIRRSDRPVLTVRCGSAATAEPMFRRILCMVDDARRSATAFEHAVGLAGDLNAELIALHVMNTGTIDQTRSALRLRQLRTLIGNVTAPARVEVLTANGNAAEQILSYARQEGADLLVISAEQKKKHAGRLTRDAHCAVMNVPGA